MGIVLMVIGAAIALIGAVPTVVAVRLADATGGLIWSERLAMGVTAIIGGIVILALGAILRRVR